MGKTGLILSTLIDYDLVGHFYENNKYEDFKKFATSKICQIINDNLIPGLVDRVEFITCSTPITLERITGNSQGQLCPM